MPVQFLQDLVLAGRSGKTPALPETDSSALSACLNTIATWIIRSHQRRALRELAKDVRALSDVGFTREQALREARKPFWRR